jgi:hypothetical protein
MSPLGWIGLVCLATVIGLPPRWPLVEEGVRGPAVLLLLSGACYVASHLLRMARMATLLGGAALSLRLVAFAHAVTGPVSGMLPFKLGEFGRIWALGHVSGGFGHGFAAVWIERALDSGLLLVVGAGLWMAQPDLAPVLAPVVVLSAVVLSGTAVVLRVVPEQLDVARRMVLRRYDSEAGVSALWTLHRLSSALDVPRRLMAGRVGSLVGLTVAVWLAEAVALAVVVGSASATAAVGGLLHVLGGVVVPGSGFPPEAALARHVAVVWLGQEALAIAALLWRSTR